VGDKSDKLTLGFEKVLLLVEFDSNTSIVNEKEQGYKQDDTNKGKAQVDGFIGRVGIHKLIVGVASGHVLGGTRSHSGGVDEFHSHPVFIISGIVEISLPLVDT